MEKISKESLKAASDKLLSLWFGEMDKQCRFPTRNLGIATKLATESRISGKELSFVAVGCLDWRNVKEGVSGQDWEIGQLSIDNQRLRRFTQELSEFQKALHSFCIPSTINITLSNVEAFALVEFDDMQAKIHHPEGIEQRITKSQENFRELIELQRINARLFDHLCAIECIFDTDNFKSDTDNFKRVRNFLSQKDAPTLRDFSDSLYRFDLTELAPSLCEDDEIGPIILNIQSTEFEEDVKSLKKLSEEIAPAVPIMAPFKNAGNWHSAPELPSHFPTKQKLVNALIGASSELTVPWMWAELLRTTPDQQLEKGLETLGIEDFKISSPEDQILAIRALCITALDEDPLLASAKNIERVIDISSRTVTLNQVIASCSGISSSEAKTWIKSGRIRVNGEVTKKTTIEVPGNTAIQIGKNKPIIVRRNT